MGRFAILLEYLPDGGQAQLRLAARTTRTNFGLKINVRKYVNKSPSEECSEPFSRAGDAGDRRIPDVDASQYDLRDEPAPYILLRVVFPGVKPDCPNLDLAFCFTLLVPDIEHAVQPLHGGGLTGAPGSLYENGHRGACVGMADYVVNRSKVEIELETVEIRVLSFQSLVAEYRELRLFYGSFVMPTFEVEVSIITHGCTAFLA